jgi:hypothetical protein
LPLKQISAEIDHSFLIFPFLSTCLSSYRQALVETATIQNIPQLTLNNAEKDHPGKKFAVLLSMIQNFAKKGGEKVRSQAVCL